MVLYGVRVIQAHFRREYYDYFSAFIEAGLFNVCSFTMLLVAAARARSVTLDGTAVFSLVNNKFCPLGFPVNFHTHSVWNSWPYPDFPLSPFSSICHFKFMPYFSVPPFVSSRARTLQGLVTPFSIQISNYSFSARQ